MVRVKEINLVCQQEFSFAELNIVVVWCLILPAVRDNSTRITLALLCESTREIVIFLRFHANQSF